MDEARDWNLAYNLIEKNYEQHSKNSLLAIMPLILIKYGSIGEKIALENIGTKLSLKQSQQLKDREMNKTSLLDFFETEYPEITKKIGTSFAEQIWKEECSKHQIDFSLEKYLLQYKELQENVYSNLDQLKNFITNAPEDYKNRFEKNLEQFKQSYESFLSKK